MSLSQHQHQHQIKKDRIYHILSDHILTDLINIIYEYYNFYPMVSLITQQYFVYDLEFGPEGIPEHSLSTQSLEKISYESCEAFERFSAETASLDKYATIPYSEWKLIKIALTRRTFGKSTELFSIFYPMCDIHYANALRVNAGNIQIYRPIHTIVKDREDRFFRVLYEFGRGTLLKFD